MSRERLFTVLEKILSVASEIYVMTQNQETIILHSSENHLLSELTKNKQEKIVALGNLEDEFETIYAQCKESIVDRQDIKRLQGLVVKIMETKEGVIKVEEKNRLVWENKRKPKLQGKPIQKPSSYMVAQYKKHDQL